MRTRVPGLLVLVLGVFLTSCQARSDQAAIKPSAPSEASPGSTEERGVADDRTFAVPKPPASEVSDESERRIAKGSPSEAAVPVDEIPAAYPIKWTKRLELSSSTNASHELATEKRDLFVELELSGETLQPATCVEWFELHGRGFTPRTSVDEHDDGIVKERCEVLRLMEKARASRQSYVRDLPWNARLLALLPAGVAWPIDPDTRARIAAATSAGRSLGEFDSKAQVQARRHPDLLEISQGDRNGTIALERLLWADLNADGIEDIVISVLNADAAR